MLNCHTNTVNNLHVIEVTILFSLGIVVGSLQWSNNALLIAAILGRGCNLFIFVTASRKTDPIAQINELSNWHFSRHHRFLWEIEICDVLDTSIIPSRP